jgi:hypothetical protein
MLASRLESLKLARTTALKLHQSNLNCIFPRRKIGYDDRKIAAVDFVTEVSLLAWCIRDQKCITGSVIILAGDNYFLSQDPADLFVGER